MLLILSDAVDAKNAANSTDAVAYATDDAAYFFWCCCWYWCYWHDVEAAVLLHDVTATYAVTEVFDARLSFHFVAIVTTMAFGVLQHGDNMHGYDSCDQLLYL